MHNNITENAWRYGNNILNPISEEYKDLNGTSTFCTNIANGDGNFSKTGLNISLSNNISKDISDITESISGNLNNMLESVDWDEFLNTALNIGSGELVSCGFVLFCAGLVTGNLILITGGLILLAIGEYGLWKTNGLSENWTLSKGASFVFDNILSIVVPFYGIGIKIGTKTVTKIIEKFTYKNGEKIFEKTIIKINEKVSLYNPCELIKNNLFNDPIFKQIKNFIIINIFPLPLFRQLVTNGIENMYGELYG